MSWWKFKVRTLDAAGLKAAAGELAAKSRSFSPDLLIGIRSGGFHVAELMASHFPQAMLLPITCRRPSTQTKQDSSVIKDTLHKLPYIVSNRLRIAEHIVLTQLRAPKQSTFTPDTNELAIIEAFIRQRNGAKILIIDDSVDSGATLAAVTNTIRDIAPTADIKTAVITVTTDSPLLQPDFPLYRYVLCRFPWSLDFKR